MMSTAAARPSTRDLAAFFEHLDDQCDAAILKATALITAHRSAYATAAKLARARRLAREALYVAVSGSEAAAFEAQRRLGRALTHETDPTGALHSGLMPLLREIVEANARARREYRTAELRRTGNLSHLSPVEQAYHRELRAAYAALRL